MFGRTFRTALLLIVCQLASGCYCCERPFFWRKGGGCCEQPCTTCCGSPAAPYGPPPMSHGVPVYPGTPVALPAAPAGPIVSPPADRMQPISSTALSR